MATFKKVLGIALLVVSGMGLLFSLAGGVGILRLRKPVLHSVEAAVAETAAALGSAERGFGAAADALDSSLVMVDTVQEAVGGISFAMEDTAPLFDSMADVFGVELPAVIQSTQDSLDAAGETAVVVDRVLYALDAISFLSGVTYDPEVPLAESIQDVSGSLDELEPTFLALESGIDVASENTARVREQLEDLQEDLGAVEEPLRNLVESLVEYAELSGGLQDRLEGFSEQLPRWINRAALGLGLVLVWNAAVQAALFSYGWELIQGVQEE